MGFLDNLINKRHEKEKDRRIEKVKKLMAQEKYAEAKEILSEGMYQGESYKFDMWSDYRYDDVEELYDICREKVREEEFERKRQVREKERQEKLEKVDKLKKAGAARNIIVLAKLDKDWDGSLDNVDYIAEVKYHYAEKNYEKAMKLVEFVDDSYPDKYTEAEKREIYDIYSICDAIQQEQKLGRYSTDSDESAKAADNEQKETAYSVTKKYDETYREDVKEGCAEDYTKEFGEAEPEEDASDEENDIVDDDNIIYFEIMASAGEAGAQYNCGVYYLNRYKENGSQEDYKKAYDWFSMAHCNGHEDAVAILEEEFDAFNKVQENSETEASVSTRQEHADKNRYERALSHLRIGTIGHIDASKPSPGIAIANTLHYYLGTGEGYVEHDAETVVEEICGSISIQTVQTVYETENRKYSHIDCQSIEDAIRYIVALGQMDTVILVIDAATGITSEIIEQVVLARETGISYLLVFIDNIDLVNKELLELDEELDILANDIRAMLDEYGYPGDDTVVISGSFMQALKNPDSEWGKHILELAEILDEYVPDVEEAIDKPFLMPIEDIFTVTGRGTVVTGIVKQGRVKLNEKLDIAGYDEDNRAITVTGIERFRVLKDFAEPGDNVGILMRGAERAQVHIGDVLAKPGTVNAQNTFHAVICCDAIERIMDGMSVYFHIHTATIQGVVSLINYKKSRKHFIKIAAKLKQFVAVETGLSVRISDMDENELGIGRIIEWHNQNQNYAESSDEEAAKTAEETEITEEHKSEKDKYYQIAWNFYYDNQYEDALRVISYIDEHLSSSYRDMDIGALRIAIEYDLAQKEEQEKSAEDIDSVEISGKDETGEDSAAVDNSELSVSAEIQEIEENTILYEETFYQVRDLIAEMFPVDADNITWNTNLRQDFNLSHEDIESLEFALEMELDVCFVDVSAYEYDYDEKRVIIENVGDIVKYIEEEGV